MNLPSNSLSLHVLSATYGRNSGAKPGNVTKHIANQCIIHYFLDFLDRKYFQSNNLWTGRLKTHLKRKITARSRSR